MKVFICANLNKEKTVEVFSQVVSALRAGGIVPMVESRYTDICSELKFTDLVFGSADENADQCDIFLTIGGDGTILRWGKKAAFHNKPLLGVNTGRLGFMAALEKEDIYKLRYLAKRKYKVSTRMMLNVSLSSSGYTKRFTALNDVVLFKGVRSKLPEYVVSRGKTEVSRIRADGLIISTPTGSTAYSLSAGGPIIDPYLSCFELTALSPHTLFSRPMIFSASIPIKAEYVAYENSSVFISADGGDSTEMFPEDTVVVEKSKLSLKIIDINGDSFYNSVHNKLMTPIK